uniref:L1 transposable element RRM domain-containing protein n=1 Tax=Latimeria chalumnae TaxID=7897 RepID=H3B8B2_LATCH
DVATDIKNVLMATLLELKDLMSALTQRVNSEEQRVLDIEDTQLRSDEEMADLRKQLTSLHARVDDQENHARRNNLRFVGFPEGVEDGRPAKFLQEVLPKLLRLSPGPELNIERAHQSLAPKPPVGQTPRPIIAKFLQFLVKEQLTAAKNLEALEWCGNRILIFPDLPRDLMERWKKFIPVKKKLREQGIKFGLFYPAIMKLTCDWEMKSYSDPQAVEEFLK